MLLITLTVFASVSSQAMDKISAMTSLGRFASSADQIRQLSNLKYSKALNSLYLPRGHDNTVVFDDTDRDTDPDDGISGVGESEMAMPPNYNVSQGCLNDTMVYLEGLLQRQPWALASKCIVKTCRHVTQPKAQSILVYGHMAFSHEIIYGEWLGLHMNV